MEEMTVRDGEFYIDSADCVIQVDNTVFRVSATHLCACLLSFGLPYSSFLAFSPLLVASAHGIVPLCSRGRQNAFHFPSLTSISMLISIFVVCPTSLNTNKLSTRAVFPVGPSVSSWSGFVCV